MAFQKLETLYRFVDFPKHDAGPETCITYGAKNKLGPITKSGNDESDMADNLLDTFQTYVTIALEKLVDLLV